MRTLWKSLAPLAAASLVLAGCGDEGTAGGADGEDLKIAAIFSGPVNDADYNNLGLLALEAAEEDGATTSYTESVAVPDIEARLNEMVGDGNNVIWTHGSQFYEATAKVANDNPDIVFIGEYDGEPENLPENVWILDRQFHYGFYSLGILAANLTETGNVGYLGGLSLPFAFSEVHAMEQAIADSGLDVTVNPVFTGDFNDASKAQQFTTQLLNSGADVIVGALNQGATGSFQAFNNRAEGDGWVTAKYTDKSGSAGSHYAGTLEYDFIEPLREILAEIEGGTTSGYYEMGATAGIKVAMSESVPAEVREIVEKSFEDVRSGAIEVEFNATPVG